MLTKWGKDKYNEQVEEYTRLFCETAVSNQWNMKACVKDTEELIQSSFYDIVTGNKNAVPPNECIVLDVAKAVEHRYR